MPICQKCQQKWSWFETIKRSLTLDHKVTCPKCNETQYFTYQSKVRGASLNFLVLLPLLINLFFDIPSIIVLSLLPIMFILVVSIYPLIVTLDNERETGHFL